MQVISPTGEVWETSNLIDETQCAKAFIIIDHPQLWWPNGYGEQPLYQVQISLKGEQAKDEKVYQIGLRTIERGRSRISANPGISEWGNPTETGNRFPPSLAECIGHEKRMQGTEIF